MAESQTPNPTDDAVSGAEYPTAVAQPAAGLRFVWLIPLAALIFAAWLGWRAWAMRGIGITVQLQDGHGLKAGDEVRFRGISVGRIDAVTLLPDLQGVIVSARLKADAEHLARLGSRFWVVRPQLRLTRVEGLETLIGPRYLAALPASADQLPVALNAGDLPRQRDFIGLDFPPTVESSEPGDLEIILQALQRGSLHPGAPVTYRQTRIGTIISVGLNSDASAVEARAHIQRPFVQLIRPATRFWDVGGVEAKVGLTGVSINIDSAEALLSGGVALATPPPQSPREQEIVRTGHRFTLAPKAESEWLEWQPMAVIGSSMLPAGMVAPSPSRATIGWTQGRWIKGERSVSGWVLTTADGLLGPADLLKPGERANPDTVVLEVAGTVVPLNAQLLWEENGLAVLKQRQPATPWPKGMMRTLTEPEECLIIADPRDQPIPLAASRLTRSGAQWQIDRALPLTQSHHGACVVSRADGRIVGLVLVSGGNAVLATLPGAWLKN